MPIDFTIDVNGIKLFLAQFQEKFEKDAETYVNKIKLISCTLPGKFLKTHKVFFKFKVAPITFVIDELRRNRIS